LVLRINFKAFVIIPAVYILVIILCILYFFKSFSLPLQNFMQGRPPAALFILPLLIFPLHLFSMFCIFYCFYFISKSLKAVEQQRNVTSGDYVGEFFLMWFSFIGVWFIQPRINKLFAGESNT